MRAYSEDLRERIVGAVVGGKHPDEVAALFQVSPATVRRFVKQQRERGHLRVALPPGRPRRLTKAHEAVLLEQLSAQPDASLAELGRRLAAATAQQVSVMTVWRTVQRLGWTRKKDPSSESMRRASTARMVGHEPRS